MLLKKTGFPQNEELVLCTITAVNPHSVFCTLDEYGGRTGMIHISEIAPGRIRNIREYVQEGKKVVCRVLQINKEKGHIDISLRRVNTVQKTQKLNQIKQEQLAEKVIEYAAKQQGESPSLLYSKLSEKLMTGHETLFEAFEKVSKGELSLEKYIDKKLAEALTTAIKTRIKPPEVKIAGDLKLSTYSPNGLQEIKNTLEVITKEGIKVRYMGAGTYHIETTAEEFKEAEKKLKTAIEKAMQEAKKKGIEAEWNRRESK